MILIKKELFLYVFEYKSKMFINDTLLSLLKLATEYLSKIKNK